MKKDNYYLVLGSTTAPLIYKVEGTSCSLNLKLFICKNPEPSSTCHKWIIADKKTGRYVCSAPSRKSVEDTFLLRYSARYEEFVKTKKYQEILSLSEKWIKEYEEHES